MAYDPETISKLTTALSGDLELYNAIINNDQTQDAKIQEKEAEVLEVSTKLQEAEQRGTQYLNQISNLLSKIPVSNTSPTKSFDQKVEEIKNSSWTK